MNQCKCSQLAHDFFGCCNDGRGNEFAAYTAEIVNPLKARIKELESDLERAAKEAEIKGMEAGFNDGLVMAKLALLEMDECEEMSHGGCSCSTIKPAIEKIDEIRAAGKEKKE